MQDFKRLRVSASARVAIRAMYAFTRTLPDDERYGLSSQLRRATISIGLNIAEGCSRSTLKDYLRFLEIARGSGMEAEFGLIAAQDLKLGDPRLRVAAMSELISSQKQLSRMISGLRKRMAVQ